MYSYSDTIFILMSNGEHTALVPSVRGDVAAAECSGEQITRGNTKRCDTVTARALQIESMAIKRSL